MNRRKFVRSSLLSAPLLAAAHPFEGKAAPAIGEKGKKQQWYELRTYLFTNDAQQQLTAAYLQQAYLPALNRAGIKNIGVFSESQPSASAVAQPPAKPAAQPSPTSQSPASASTQPPPPMAQPPAPPTAQPQPPASATGEPQATHLFLLVPFDSIDSFAAIDAKLSLDTAYAQAGEAYLSAPAANPAYLRIESSLLRAFRHMPSIEVPEKKERIFEMRRYESPSESAGQKKIEMFNSAGEIDIFKKAGARPVFFGETMIGQRRPNLTYMLCFDDMAAHDAHWKHFGSDPDWKRISTMPEYLDARLISKITRTFLTPTPYSQI